MPVLGVTGGAACGKSSFVAALLPLLPGAQSFSADAAVSQLAEQDAEVRGELKTLLGKTFHESFRLYHTVLVKGPHDKATPLLHGYPHQATPRP